MFCGPIHISNPKLLYVPGNSPLVPGPALALADVGHKGTPPYRSFVLTQNQRLSSVAVLWDLTRVYIRLKKNAHPSSRLGTHVLSALPFGSLHSPHTSSSTIYLLVGPNNAIYSYTGGMCDGKHAI